jgi:hypothetical protein
MTSTIIGDEPEGDDELTPDVVLALRGATTALGDLGGRIDRFSESIAHLTRYGRVNRLMIGALAVAGTIGIAIIVTIGALIVQTHDTANKATAAASAATAAAAANMSICESSNAARAAETQLWDYVLGLSPVASQTPAQQAQIAKFRLFLAQDFAPRDCANLH